MFDGAGHLDLDQAGGIRQQVTPARVPVVREARVETPEGTLPERITAWMSRQKVTQGRHAGETFTVLPWQEQAVEALYGRREHLVCALSAGRGIGKSTFLALLGCCCLVGPLAQPRGEVVVVASSLDQAKIVFRHAKAFLRPQLEGSRRASWRSTDGMNVGVITNTETGVVFKAISSDPRRAHGLAPQLAILDEPAQWPDGTSDAMLAAIRTSLGKQPGSRMFCIGTRPASGEGHWFEAMLQGGADWSLTYCADENDPIDDPATWRKAAPSLDHFPDLEAAIAGEAKLALRDPAQHQAFLSLRLNLGVRDVEASVLIPGPEWQHAEADEPAEGPLLWGLDLASTAFCGLAAYWPETGRLDGLLGCCSNPGLHERGQAAGVGSLYITAHERGELILAGERLADIRQLIDAGLERFGEPVAIVCDRYRIGELEEHLDGLFGQRRPWLWPRGTGYIDMGADVRAFRELFYAGDIKPATRIVLRDAMRNARLITDPSGNHKLARTGADRRRKAPDDLAAAMILAAGVAYREPKNRRPSQRAQPQAA
ncbi:MAG: terminase large subunit [Chloroflexi bacterium]|nr:terminase large subunit [Chloroflexota bacterium]